MPWEKDLLVPRRVYIYHVKHIDWRNSHVEIMPLFLTTRRGWIFQHLHPWNLTYWEDRLTLWSRQWHFPRLILFLDTENQSFFKMKFPYFWDVPIFSGAFAVSSQGGKSDSRDVLPILFIQSCPVPKQHFRPRYQASEEFVQESLGPGEMLRGCWPYERLIKGNQWLRSPDHKALFLGGVR